MMICVALHCIIVHCSPNSKTKSAIKTPNPAARVHKRQGMSTKTPSLLNHRSERSWQSHRSESRLRFLLGLLSGDLPIRSVVALVADENLARVLVNVACQEESRKLRKENNGPQSRMVEDVPNERMPTLDGKSASNERACLARSNKPLACEI